MSERLIDDANIDGPGGMFRYWLTRGWADAGTSGRWVNWICLNPSTADANKDDATVRRLIAFTKLWGYAGLWLTNLYAFRATDPRKLPGYKTWETDVAIGPENDKWIRLAAAHADKVIVAWGDHAPTARVREVVLLLNAQANAQRELLCLGTTASGQPKHPLYIKSDTPLEPWKLWRLKP